MHILIAEDDSILSDGLAYFLRKRGHSVALAADGETAIRAINADGIDLLVLDFGLLKVAGTEVLKSFRAQNPHLPVLLISGLDDAYDRVLRMGLTVDEYLPKPFGLKEFEASIGKLTQQPFATTSLPLEFGPLTFDPASGDISLRKDALELRPHERSLLGLLIQLAARSIGNQEFAKRLSEWMNDVGHNAVDNEVDGLRRRLENSGLRIVLVRGLGYRLVEEEKS